MAVISKLTYNRLQNAKNSVFLRQVKTIEYDPNRNVRISLVFYADGEKRYILTPEGLNVGDVIVSGPEAAIQTGNALPLELIPLGSIIHNIEMEPGRGGILVRSAGNSAQLMAKEGNYVTIKLPSSEMRMIRKDVLLLWVHWVTPNSKTLKQVKQEELVT